MKNNFKTFAVGFVLISSLLLSIGGCHTAEGFGKDLEKGGKEIQKAATDNTTVNNS